MSHRIIIGSTHAASVPTISQDHQTKIETRVEYTPSHGESDEVMLRKVARIQRLVRKIEAVIDDPADTAEETADG